MSPKNDRVDFSKRFSEILKKLFYVKPELEEALTRHNLHTYIMDHYKDNYDL